MALTDFRISVYSPDAATCKVLDCAQSDFGGGMVKVEDLQTGCGSATLTVGLRFEELVNRGYWTARNLVEISSGDDVLTAATLAGATSLPTSNPQLYDPALGEDAQQVYLWDGATLAMRIPVTGVTANSITIGQPKNVAGSSYQLPAFAQGTVLGRRRYAGYVMRRETLNEKAPKATITLAGVARRLDEAIGTWTYNAQDIGTAIGLAINGFSNRYPELLPGSYPTVGLPYSGSKQRVSVAKMVADIMSAIVNGDQWVLRIGHDRTPRLVKTYTSSSNTYTYTQTFGQGVTYFEPVGFKQAGEDASRLFNSVEVIGDTNAATKQIARAIVQDTLSIGLNGQIDATPVTNTACKTDAACATYARAILLQQSLALASNTFRVYTHNDYAGSAGLPSNATQKSGDVVRALANIVVQRFDAGGTSTNAVPDSEIRYGSGVGALWSGGNGNMTVSVGGGPGGSNAFTATRATGAPAQYEVSENIDVAPGQVWSFDAWVDAMAVTSGQVSWAIAATVGGAIIGQVVANAAAPGTRYRTSITIPSGCYQVYASPYMSTAVGTAKFAQPNFNIGTQLLPYAPNYAIPDIYGIASSVVSTYDTRGDSYQDVQFAAVQPDANAALAERTNAVATALVNNRATPVGIDSFIVDAYAFGYAYAGLVVNTPLFYAQFAVGTKIIAAGGNAFTLAGSTTNWAWLNPDGTWTIHQDPASVSGAILYAIFQTSATAIVGSINKAPVGVLRVGVGNISVGKHPVPTFGAPTIVQVASTIPTSQDVMLSVLLTNVPQDQSVGKAIFYYRMATAGTPANDWIPAPEVNLAGGVNPPAVQTVEATVSQLDAGLSYDFAIAYCGPADFGPLAVLTTNFSVQSLVITAPYLSRMAAPAPTYAAGAAATAGPSPNGTNVSVTVTVPVNNQPTDGTLIDAHLWYRLTGGATAWTDGGIQRAAVPAAASATYVFYFSDLAAGQTYDFGLSYEGVSGTTAITEAVHGWAAPSIAITAASFKGVGAHPGPAGTVAATITQVPSTIPTSQDVQIAVPLTNVPTDGSVFATQFYYRQNRATNDGAWIPAESVQLAGLPTPPASQTITVVLGQLMAGLSYDFAISYEAQSDFGPLTQIASGFAVKSLVITAPYLSQMIAPAPTYAAGAVASAGPSPNGTNVSVTVTVPVNNQPTDGTLVDTHLWYRLTGAANTWTDGGIQRAAVPAAVSATYTFYFSDLAAGQTYDFGLSYEGVSGTTAITEAVHGWAAPSIAITAASFKGIGAHPGPAGSTTTITQVPSAIPTSQDVQIVVPLTNVPTDGSVFAAQFYYRQNGGANANWIPAESIQLAGLPTPPASQTVTVVVGQLMAGLSYDFALSYEAQSDFGPLTQIASGFAVKSLVIGGAYLSGMAAAAPTYAAGAAATAGPSPNGTNVSVTVSVPVNNQPTDGTLIDVHLWYRLTGGASAWTDGGIARAAVPAAVSTTYTFYFSDLAAGQTYDFGSSYEGVSGTTAITEAVHGWVAPSIAITAASFRGVGNHPGPAGSTTTITQVPSAIPTSQDVQIIQPLTNVPTDGSVFAAQFYYRQSGGANGTWIPAESVQLAGLPRPPASQTVTVVIGQLMAGYSYDFALSYEAQSDFGPLTPIVFGFAVKSLVIGGAYLLNGAAQPGPLYAAGNTATPAASANGISAAVSLVIGVTNQPTDTSLRKVHLFYRNSGSTAWSDGGYQTAVGAGSNTPPASASYAFSLTDLTGGATYDFGIAYDSYVGETPITAAISGYVAPAVAIPPSATTFQNVLNSAFNGLQIDQSGMLAMTVQREIFPAQQITAQNPKILQNDVLFSMKFNMSSTTQYPVLVLYSDAGATETTYRNGYLAQWENGAISLYKRVNGTFTQFATVTAASNALGSFIAPGGPVPPKDTGWHVLSVMVGKSLTSPDGGLEFMILLDGTIYLFAGDYPAGSTTLLGHYPVSAAQVNVGGVAPYTSGRCGPGNRGDGSTTLIDPSNFQIKQGAQTFGETNASATSNAFLTTAELTVGYDGSPLRSGLLARRHNQAAFGHNELFNPVMAQTLAGWTLFTNAGAGGGANADATFGGRAHVYVSAGAWPGPDALIYQAPSLIAGLTYTVSGVLETGSLNAGGFAAIDTGPNTALFYSSSTANSSQKAFSATFFAQAGTQIRLRVNAGSNSPTVSTDAYFYQLQVEVGSVASQFTDSQGDGLLALTHDASGNLDHSRAQAGKPLPFSSHNPQIQNRHNVHVSCAGRMPYMSAATVLTVPSTLLLVRSNGQFCRVTPGTLSIPGAPCAVFINWVNGGNASVAGGILYNDANYQNRLIDPGYEILGHVNGDGTANTFQAPWLNADHFSAVQGVIDRTGHAPASTFLNKQGSTLPAVMPTLTFTGTYTGSSPQIEVVSSGYAIYPDGSVSGVPVYDQVFAGLAVNAYYYFVYSYNPTTNAIVLVAGPQTYAASNTVIQSIYNDGAMPITGKIKILTPSVSGTQTTGSAGGRTPQTV